jgi:gentisate 1,2-dioxygenase
MAALPPHETARLTSFYDDLASVDLQPLWTQTRSLMPGTPTPAALPWLWSGSTLHALADRARDLITIERGGERRVLALANPGLDGLPYATPTLWGAVQALGPHERAPAHRHTAAAIRFVLEGDGVWTTVDGDACRMHPGDLVLTPAWTFHDHTNDGDQPMLWFDGLDLPLAAALDAVFYENHPDLNQPVTGFDLSEQRYAAPGVIVRSDRCERAHSPLLVYRWEQSDRALRGLIDTADAPMVSIEFVNPTNGRPALPTMSCSLHRLIPAGRTASERKTGSSIFVVYRGRGRSVIGGQTFDWSAGDMFVVPSWSAVDHEAEEPSDMFEVSDEAALRALHLFRQETLDHQQEATTAFTPRELGEPTAGAALPEAPGCAER